MGKSAQQSKTGILREFSSGGVVFKKEKGEILWLVAATKPNDLFPKLSWRLPKGWIDDSDTWGIPGPIGRGDKKATDEDLESAATREVGEEGGVEAKIIRKIGSEKIFFKHPERGLILKFVTFFLMEWQRDLPEGFGEETSAVEWLAYEEARKKLSYSGEKKMLDKAKQILDLGV